MEWNSVRRTSRRLRNFGVAALVGGSLLANGGGVASAMAAQPQSGDSRAFAVSGNVTTCAEAGLSGEDVTAKLVSAIRQNIYIDVTSVDPGTTVTGIVVKGGAAYNVYLASALGLPPWIGLHAPLVGSGQPAEIGQYFACGRAVSPTSTTTTTKTTTTAPTSTTTAPTSTTTTPPTSTTTTVTTTSTRTAITVTKSPTVGPEPSEHVRKPGKLANTGPEALWLIPVGLLLVLGGAGVLLWHRRARSAGR